MGPDSWYCGKRRKISKSRHDLGLGSTMPNIELVIYYSVLKFHIPRSNSFLSYCAKHTHRNKHNYK